MGQDRYYQGGQGQGDQGPGDYGQHGSDDTQYQGNRQDEPTGTAIQERDDEGQFPGDDDFGGAREVDRGI